MEINAEINKVFGQEMAKLFAAQISEEDMLKQAKETWIQMNAREYRYGSYSDSKIDELIKDRIRARMREAVDQVTSTEAFKSQTKQLAEQIVQEIIEKTHEKVVEEVSSRLAGMSVGGYGFGLKGMIEQTVAEMSCR